MRDRITNANSNAAAVLLMGPVAEQKGAQVMRQGHNGAALKTMRNMSDVSV